MLNHQALKEKRKSHLLGPTVIMIKQNHSLIIFLLSQRQGVHGLKKESLIRKRLESLLSFFMDEVSVEASEVGEAVEVGEELLQCQGIVAAAGFSKKLLRRVGFFDFVCVCVCTKELALRMLLVN